MPWAENPPIAFMAFDDWASLMRTDVIEAKYVPVFQTKTDFPPFILFRHDFALGKFVDRTDLFLRHDLVIRLVSSDRYFDSILN